MPVVLWTRYEEEELHVVFMSVIVAFLESYPPILLILHKTIRNLAPLHLVHTNGHDKSFNIVLNMHMVEWEC